MFNFSEKTWSLQPTANEQWSWTPPPPRTRKTKGSIVFKCIRHHNFRGSIRFWNKVLFCNILFKLVNLQGGQKQLGLNHLILNSDKWKIKLAIVYVHYFTSNTIYSYILKWYTTFSNKLCYILLICFTYYPFFFFCILLISKFSGSPSISCRPLRDLV